MGSPPIAQDLRQSSERQVLYAAGMVLGNLDLSPSVWATKEKGAMGNNLIKANY